MTDRASTARKASLAARKRAARRSAAEADRLAEEGDGVMQVDDAEILAETPPPDQGEAGADAAAAGASEGGAAKGKGKAARAGAGGGTGADPATAPAPYHHGDLRAALINAAMDVLAEEGRAAFSLRRVTARAGVSHTANRNHFGDFAGLRAAVAAEGFDRLGAAMEAALDMSGPSRAEGAAAVTAAYIAFAEGAPGLFQLMFDLAPEGDAKGVAGAALRNALRPMHRAAKDLELATPLPPLTDGRSPGLYLWALAHGHAQLAVAGGYRLAAPPDGRIDPIALPEEEAPPPSGGGAAAAAARAMRAEARRKQEEEARAAAEREARGIPDFGRIAPRMRFSQPFAFESLSSSPGAPTLGMPKERR